MRIFISYSHVDKKFVRKLKSDLKKDNFTALTEDDFIHYGDNIEHVVNEYILDSNVFFIVVSYNSIRSEWVPKELFTALNAEQTGKTKVIPILRNGNKRLLARLNLQGKLAVDFSSNYLMKKNFSRLISDLKHSANLTNEIIPESVAENIEKYYTVKSPIHSEAVYLNEAEKYYDGSKSDEYSGHDIIPTSIRNYSDRPFVSVGDKIEIGQILCVLVDCTLMFSYLKSPVEGYLVKIIVDDKSMIEYDEGLFLIKAIELDDTSRIKRGFWSSGEMLEPVNDHGWKGAYS